MLTAETSATDRVQEIRARARVFYEAGVCPGCDAPLVLVAGVGKRHWLPGQKVRTWTGFRTTVHGDIAHSAAGENDPRLCEWTADQLTALVHIGSGLVS